MQFSEDCQVAHTRKPPRMVVLRNIVGRQPYRYIEFSKNSFDVSLQGIEIEITPSVMDACGPKFTAGGEYQRSTRAAGTVDLAEFVKLQIAIATVQIPLNRFKHSGDEGSTQNRLFFAHRILKADGLDIGIEAVLQFLIAEGIGIDLAVTRCRECIAQLTRARFVRQQGAESTRWRHRRREFVEAVVASDLFKEIFFGSQ